MATPHRSPARRPLPRLARLALAGAAVAAIGACAHKRPPMTEPPPPPPPPAAGLPGAYRPPGQVGAGAYGSARPGSEQDFVQSAGDRVYFAYDQYTLTPEARAVLDGQAQWLQRYPAATVRVEGNADERGTEEYNFALAGRRSDSVKTYLVERGVPAGRVVTISYGKERPIDTSGTDEGLAKNRNAHTALTGGAG